MYYNRSEQPKTAYTFPGCMRLLFFKADISFSFQKRAFETLPDAVLIKLHNRKQPDITCGSVKTHPDCSMESWILCNGAVTSVSFLRSRLVCPLWLIHTYQVSEQPSHTPVTCLHVASATQHNATLNIQPHSLDGESGDG